MSEPANLDDLARALSDGLDLCVRGRKLDEQVNVALAAGGVGQMERPHGGAGTRCMTPALWVLDQYDSDLAAWEAKTRALLCRLPAFS